MPPVLSKLNLIESPTPSLPNVKLWEKKKIPQGQFASRLPLLKPSVLSSESEGEDIIPPRRVPSQPLDAERPTPPRPVFPRQSQPPRAAPRPVPPPAPPAQPRQPWFLIKPPTIIDSSDDQDSTAEDAAVVSSEENVACGNCSLNCPQEHNPLTNFDRNQSAKAKIKAAINRGHKTREKRLRQQTMTEVVKKCRECKCSSTCCSGVHFAMVKGLRDELYGDGTNQDTRRHWRFESMLGIYEDYLKDPKCKGTDKNPKLNYYLMDNTKTRHEVAKKIPVCRECYGAVLGFSNGTITDTWQAIVRDKQRVQSDVRVPKAKGKTSEWLNCSSWIEMWTQGLCCFSPDCKKHELPAAMTLKFMYEKFCEDWTLGVISGAVIREHFGRMKVEEREQNPPPSYEYFTKVWKEDFSSEINIPRTHKRFAMCNWCAELKNRLVREKDREMKLYWRAQLYRHYEWVTLQRRKYYKHRKKATEFPEQ